MSYFHIPFNEKSTTEITEINIADLKKLAGIGEHNEEPSMGENISHTATALRQKEKL